ncbi:MAG: type II secretion system F family protein [Planctomycetota bacterium]
MESTDYGWVAELAALGVLMGLAYLAYRFRKRAGRRKGTGTKGAFERRFTMLVATFLRAGVPLAQGLENSRLAESAGERKIAEEIVAALRGGASLGEALGPHEEIFGELYVQLVRVGEQAGRLPETFERLQAYGALIHERQVKLLAALLYPAVVSVNSLAVFVFVLIRIVPQFEKMWAELGIALPVATVVLVSASRFLSRSLPFWLASFLVIYVAFKGLQAAGKRYQACRALTDGAVMMIPFGRRMFLDLSIGRAALVIQQLVSYGVGLPEALRIAGQMRINYWFARWLRLAAERMEAGAPADEALEAVEGEGLWRRLSLRKGEASYFEPALVAHVRWGIRTGDLAGALQRLSEHYLHRGYARAQILADLVVPAWVMVNGLIVGTIALGLFSPLLSLMHFLSRG